MPEIDDARVQPALEAMLTADVAVLRSLFEHDSELVTTRWGENTLLEWVTQPPHGVDSTIVSVLIEAGSDLDRPLCLAGCWNLAGLCAQLLEAGADPTVVSADGVTPLESAVMHGSIEAADVLAGAGLHRPSLWLAAACGRVDDVAAWFDAADDRWNGPGPYRPNLADVGHPHGPATSDDPSDVLSEAMVFAQANNRMSVVELLAAHGVSIDATTHLDVTGLHLAILFRNAQAVAAILDRGARTDLRDGRFDSDAAGWARACLSDDPRSHEIAVRVGTSP